MNNKIKKLIIVFITFLFTIFLFNIFIKEAKINKSDITNNNERTIIINFLNLISIFYFYS